VRTPEQGIMTVTYLFRAIQNEKPTLLRKAFRKKVNREKAKMTKLADIRWLSV
jgi:hypothetical protein